MGRVVRLLLLPLLAAGLSAALVPTRAARAFSVFPQDIRCFGPCYLPDRVVDVPATLTEARRWNAAPHAPFGLWDGIQVGVASDFAAQFEAYLDVDEAAVQGAIASSFAAWETRELGFDIRFDEPNPYGFEIALLADDGTSPVFQGNTFAGYATVDSQSWFTRQLTNGQLLPGQAISQAEILINVPILLLIHQILVNNGLATDADLYVVLQHFVMHEIGHALGLHHPNELLYANLDSDLDPTSPVSVDPLDPFAGLMVSPNADPLGLMWGGPPTDAAWFFLTELRPDDRAGLEVLYPSLAPEPRAALLLGPALGALGLARRRYARARRRTRRR